MTDKKLDCFVISPIGSPGTAIRKEADWVLRKLIRPALEESYSVVRADEFTKGEIITNRVITSIQSADLLVAVMSGHNPNVFYELAVAHAYTKPIVPLIKDGENIPFDVGLVGTIFYSHDDVHVWDAAIADLRAAAHATRAPDYQASNPITMALGAAKASASPDSSDQMIAKLAAELAAIRREMEEMQSATPGFQFPSLLKHSYGNERLADIYSSSTIDGKAETLAAVLLGAHINREEARLGRALTKDEITVLARDISLSRSKRTDKGL